jgi:methylphosphotriester-DNA--protein-cysteine methyltransferase
MVLARIRLAAHVPHGRGVEPRGEWRTLSGLGLTFVRRGRGAQQQPGRAECTVSAPAVILTLPHSLHWFGPSPRQTWDESFAVGEGPLFDWLAAQLIQAGANPVWLVDDVEWVEGVFQQAVSSPESVGPLVDLVLRMMPKQRNGPPWLEAATTRLQETKDPVDVIASDSGMATAAWRQAFVVATGLTPARYRIQHRIGVAKDLLQLTGMTVREIAERLGYADEFVFSRQFKLETGTSPKAFREQGANTDRP